MTTTTITAANTTDGANTMSGAGIMAGVIPEAAMAFMGCPHTPQSMSSNRTAIATPTRTGTRIITTDIIDPTAPPITDIPDTITHAGTFTIATTEITAGLPFAAVEGLILDLIHEDGWSGHLKPLRAAGRADAYPLPNIPFDKAPMTAAALVSALRVRLA
jgi:hypothetical protein